MYKDMTFLTFALRSYISAAFLFSTESRVIYGIHLVHPALWQILCGAESHEYSLNSIPFTKIFISTKHAF